MADQHYREAIAEHLESNGLAYAPAPVQPVDTYVRARMLLRERRVKIHRTSLPEGMAERLMQQLREVQGKPTAGGGMSIIHPRWSKGGHGDIASAFVLAIWQLSGDEVKAPKPKMGTQEWEAAARDIRRKQLQQEKEQQWWKRGQAGWQGRFGR
jgi:hypothetical protein